MHEIAEEYNDVLNSDIQFAFAIYECIVMRTNSIPELTVERLFFNYYESIVFYTTTLFGFWLFEKQMIFADQEEQDYFMELHRKEFEERLYDMLNETWKEVLGLTFVRMAQSSEEIVNSPLQNVW